MLPKKFRLPAKEFGSVYQKGKKFRGEYGMLIVANNSINNPRFGFVVSKKIGNAVLRHRFTRLLRVIVMEMVKELKLESMGKDFQFVAFKFCNEKDVLKEEILKQMKEVLND